MSAAMQGPGSARARISVVPVLVIGAALGSDAHALGPLDVEVGAKAGGGSNLIGGGFPNPLGFGAGGRAGVSIAGFYGGISAMYYVGESASVHYLEGVTFESGAVSPHSVLYGVELGYGLKVARILVLRAQLGAGDDLLGMGGGVAVGLTIDNILTPARPVPDAHYLYLEPGGTVLVEIGTFYAGVDVNALLLPSGPRWPPAGIGSRPAGTIPFYSNQGLDASLTAHAQVGVRF